MINRKLGKTTFQRSVESTEEDLDLANLSQMKSHRTVTDMTGWADPSAKTAKEGAATRPHYSDSLLREWSKRGSQPSCAGSNNKKGPNLQGS